MRIIDIGVTALASAAVALALHFWLDHSSRVTDEQLPSPSLAKSCLPISDGLNTYQPSEVESADFCAPGSASIQSVTMSNENDWGFSQPWQAKETILTMRDRLAFTRKTAKPGANAMKIRTANGVYQVVIAADPASGAQP